MPEIDTDPLVASQPETPAPACERSDSSVYNPAIHGPNFCPDCG